MSISRSKAKDQKPLKNSGGKASNDLPPLRNLSVVAPVEVPGVETQSRVEVKESAPPYEGNGAAVSQKGVARSSVSATDAEIPISTNGKAAKKEKRTARDRELLEGDRWLSRNGHAVTYFGLYLFSIMVLFRPYELVPGLSFLSSTAFYFAIATLAIFIPSQLATEGNLTTFSTEVKAILAICGAAAAPDTAADPAAT